MRKATGLSLVLAVVHGVSGILVLMVSSWFIAACAIAPASFNFVLPAVAVRGLALLRIASGYAHLWLGHDDVLTRTADMRLSLFAALRNKRFTTRAEGIEALAQHTQAVASVWVGWVAQQASTLAILSLSLTVSLLWALPGGQALAAMAVGWLLLSLYLVFFGVAVSTRKLAADEHFRFASEHFFRTSSLWHLSQQPLTQYAPSALDVWRAQQQLSSSGKWQAWYLQAIAYIALGLLLWADQPRQYATPLALVVPLMLLAVPEWLGRSLSVFPAFAQWRESRRALQQVLDSPPLEPLQEQVPGTLTLAKFGVPGRFSHTLDVSFPAKGLCLLLGSSGTGKSSLLQAIAGQIHAEGQRRVGTQYLAPGPVAGWRYVEQTPLLINGSLRDNLYPYGGPQDDEAARYWLDRLGLAHLDNLDEWLGCNGRQLSGGEKKRLILARTALTHPQLWLVDEPFEGLDPSTQQIVANLLLERSQSALVVVATHLQPFAREHIERLLDLDVSVEQVLCSQVQGR